jgi:hypothetical protein
MTIDAAEVSTRSYFFKFGLLRVRQMRHRVESKWHQLVSIPIFICEMSITISFIQHVNTAPSVLVVVVSFAISARSFSINELGRLVSLAPNLAVTTHQH